MAVTPTTTTIKTGTTPTSGYMIGAFQASSPPFIVKKTFEVIDQVQSYRAVAKASAVSNAFQLEKLSAPADNAIIKEYRTPYTHTYFPVYSGATAVTRCENILLTYIFLDDIPLYYQWTVVDANDALVTVSLTEDFPEQVSLTVNGRPYSNYTIIQNLDGSLSLHTDKRLANMKLTIAGVSYFPNPYPVMKWIASSGSFTADGGSPQPHEFNITNGIIYVNIANEAQEWSVGYAEYFDFLQDGFPIIGVDFIDWHSRWRIMASAGSIVTKNNGKTDIFDIGSTTIGTRIHYGVKLTQTNNLNYFIGEPARAIIAVYKTDGTAVTLSSKDPLNGRIVVSTAQTDSLYVDYTTIDRFATSELQVNYGPTYDSNYFTVGTAKKDFTTNIYVRALKDVVNEAPVSKSIAHYTSTAIGLDDATVAGTFSGSQDATYVVNIDSVGGTDTFEWSDNGGTTYTTGVNCSATPVSLSNGVTIVWGAATGHSITDSWTWEEYNGSSDFWVTTSNEMNKHVDYATSTLKEITSNYILLAEIIYPEPQNTVEKIIFRGQVDDLFKLSNYDPREFPVASLDFNNTDTLDINADPATRTITIQVPNNILDHASKTEVEQEIRKFIPLGTQLIVNYKV